MKKIIMIQKLKGNKRNNSNSVIKDACPDKSANCFETRQSRPLQIYYIAENRSEFLYTGEKKRVFISSGAFANYEIQEKFNAYGVKFRIENSRTEI